MTTIEALRELQCRLRTSANEPGRMDMARSLCDLSIARYKEEAYRRTWRGRYNRFVDFWMSR